MVSLPNHGGSSYAPLPAPQTLTPILTFPHRGGRNPYPATVGSSITLPIASLSMTNLNPSAACDEREHAVDQHAVAPLGDATAARSSVNVSSACALDAQAAHDRQPVPVQAAHVHRQDAVSLRASPRSGGARRPPCSRSPSARGAGRRRSRTPRRRPCPSVDSRAPPSTRSLSR